MLCGFYRTIFETIDVGRILINEQPDPFIIARSNQRGEEDAPNDEACGLRMDAKPRMTGATSMTERALEEQHRVIGQIGDADSATL